MESIVYSLHCPVHGVAGAYVTLDELYSLLVDEGLNAAHLAFDQAIEDLYLVAFSSQGFYQVRPDEACAARY
jgi:hypothetical protein